MSDQATELEQTARTTGEQAEPEARAIFKVGDRVGRLTILGVIGEGGFGKVYSAWDDHLRRKVALKLMRSDKGATGQRRFQAEAEALAALSHPNVVPVFDVFEHGGETVLAMEFVEGLTLTDWAPQNDWKRVVEACLQAARGLAAVHGAGLVHRDFKPDNVMVGVDGRVRLADFGLATRITSRDESTQLEGPEPTGVGGVLGAHITRPGAVVGTPYFMAPEVRQRLGASPESDQFAFCKTLEYLLEGRPRGGADDAVPAWVDEVIGRGLAASPKDRAVNMLAVTREIEARLGLPSGMDPNRGRTQRAVLISTLLLGNGPMVAAMALMPGHALDARILFWLVVWLVSLFAGSFYFTHLRFDQTVGNRKSIGFLTLSVGGMFLNRAAGWALGLPASQVLTQELVILTVLLVAGGFFVRAWLLPGSSIMALGALLCVLVPSLAPYAFIAATTASLVMGLVMVAGKKAIPMGVLEQESGMWLEHEGKGPLSRTRR